MSACDVYWIFLHSFYNYCCLPLARMWPHCAGSVPSQIMVWLVKGVMQKKKKEIKGYFYSDFLKLSSINVKFGVYVECTINHLYFTDQKDSLSHFCGVTPLNFAICTDFVLHQWYSFFKCKLWYLHYFLIGFLQSASSVNVFPKFELQIAFNPVTCLLCLFLNVMKIWMIKWGKN